MVAKLPKKPRVRPRAYVLQVPLNDEERETLEWIRAEAQTTRSQVIRHLLRRERRRILEGTRETL